jgi:hypothetical protein
MCETRYARSRQPSSTEGGLFHVIRSATRRPGPQGRLPRYLPRRAPARRVRSKAVLTAWTLACRSASGVGPSARNTEAIVANTALLVMVKEV